MLGFKATVVSSRTSPLGRVEPEEEDPESSPLSELSPAEVSDVSVSEEASPVMVELPAPEPLVPPAEAELSAGRLFSDGWEGSLFSAGSETASEEGSPV